MFKKLLALAIGTIFCAQITLAKEVSVQITPAKEYKTSNNSIHEGDELDFVLVNDVAKYKKGTLIKGLVTSVTENGFGGRSASVYIEQFKINNNYLKGIVYQKGNPHPLFFEYIGTPSSENMGISIIRGGEVFLRPNKDIFTLYLEVKE